MTEQNEDLKIKKAVREHYAHTALTTTPCCGSTKSTSTGCGCGVDVGKKDPVSLTNYSTEEKADLPEDVTNLSLGCGDPVKLASLKPGQVVLDLGSGGGIDCFMAGKKVGPEGRVIGVDMTPEMIDKARQNKLKMGAENVEFRLGEIEHLPVADNSIDVVISNCVINLSTDKPQVVREILRVLKPGGRMAVSDIVTSGDLPDEIKKSLSDWAGCIAGAMDAGALKDLLQKTGFTHVELKPVYFNQEMVDEAYGQLEYSHKYDKQSLSKTVFSADISAVKPQ